MSSWPARRDLDDADRVYGGEGERTKSAMISEAEEVLLPQEEQQDKHQQPRFLLQQSSQTKSGYHLYDRFSKKALFIGQIVLFAIVVVQFIMLIRSYSLAAVAAARLVDAGVVRGKGADVGSDSAKSDLPDYLVTKPMLLPGPTPTGEPAFLAQSNPAPFASTTYVPPQPLETQVPIEGQVGDDAESIFTKHGQLSHYFSNPHGFGAEEHPMPENASIVQLNMLSRHGARYPTAGSGVEDLAAKLKNYTTGVLGDVTFTDDLSFLNTWDYKLGQEILVPVGKQELFMSGTLHQYLYGHLYPNDGKIIARSTTQRRMIESAEYFLAGFFGLEWTNNATLVLARENLTGTFNNSLAGYQNCPNANNFRSFGGNNATKEWTGIYLANATERLHAQAPGFNWTIKDSYDAQSMCAYETVALGFSAFCGLFTYDEWEGYEYSIDLSFAGNNAFQSPTGRAVGIGYVEEILARLREHVISSPVAQINVTLDENPETFPLDQALNLDFSHDTNIMAVLTAFGFTQFAPLLPTDHIPASYPLRVSHVTPFAARLDMEIIKTPSPLSGDRSNGPKYTEGGETKYIHFVLNQRTLPLGKNFKECGERDDGWCELETFLKVQEESLGKAQYEYACFGEYEAAAWGEIMDGAPVPVALEA